MKDIWILSQTGYLPLGSVGFGCPIKREGKLIAITRMPWQNPNPCHPLQPLQFAEAAVIIISSLSLVNHELNSGQAPTEIFGLTEIR